MSEEPEKEPAISAQGEERLEALFGELAVRLGFVTAEVVRECLEEQRRLSGAGDHIKLGQLLLKRGHLALTQFLEVLKQQERSVLRCASCGKVYNFNGAVPEEALTCLKCGAKLSVPLDTDMVADEPHRVTPYQTSPYKPGQVQLGKYRLIREVARGGMGVVYEAEDPDLKRRVALKILKEGEAGVSVVQRLHREAALAARLQHPNIIAIHEVGAVRDREQTLVHYICMDYIDGETLQAAMQVKKYASREFLEIMEKVARAVHYAHTQGVVHRDLKPANILLDRVGRPVVTDFGLAKMEDDQTTRLTRSNAVMGTPLYMAPEQVQGHGSEIDAKTDIYALGVTLYEGLVGQAPYTGETAVDVYRRIVEEEPTRLRKINTRLDNDIETITLKAMAKERSRRYASAEELAEDLKRFLAGEQINAQPPSTLGEILRKVRKRKAIYGLSSLSVLLVLVLGWWVWRSNRRVEALHEIDTVEQELMAVSGRGDLEPEQVQEYAGGWLDKLHAIHDEFPSEVKASITMARIYRLLAEEEKIEATLKDALQRNPDHGLIHYEMARFCREQVAVGSLLMKYEMPSRRKALGEREVLVRATFEKHLRRSEELSGSIGGPEAKISRMQQQFELTGLAVREAISQMELAGAEVKRLRGDPDSERGDLVEAEEQLRRAEEAVDRARLLHQEQCRSVEKDATDMIDRKGFTAYWRMLRSDARNVLGDFKGVVEDRQAAADVLPLDPYIRLYLALAWDERTVRSPDRVETLREIKTLLRLRPDWSLAPTLRYWRSHILTLCGVYDEALTEIQEACRERSPNAWAQFHLGHVYALLKRPDEAEEALKKALLFEEIWQETPLRLGDVYYLKQDYSRALQSYKEGMSLYETLRHMDGSKLTPGKEYYGTGRALLRLGDHNGALSAISTAIEGEARIGSLRNPAYYYSRAEIFRAQKNWPAALAGYTEALALRDPALTKDSYVRTVADEVLWVFLRMYDTEPEDQKVPASLRRQRMWGRLFYARGLVHEAMGNAEAASKDFEDAKKQDETEGYRRFVPPNPK